MSEEMYSGESEQPSIAAVSETLIGALVPADVEQSPYIRTGYALSMATSACVRTTAVLEGSSHPEADIVRDTLDNGVEELKLALAALVRAEDALNELLGTWGMGAPASTPQRFAEEWIDDEQGAVEVFDHYEPVPAHDSRPIPRLSEHDLFQPDVQARLDTPIEDVLGLTPEQRDVGNKRAPLSRLRRTGVWTLRDAIVSPQLALLIYDLGVSRERVQEAVQAAFPEIPVYDDRFDGMEGARVAQVCTSFDQFPLQHFTIGRRRNPEMYHSRVTIADVLDDEGNPYEPREYGGAYIKERRYHIPTWYDHKAYRLLQKFFNDYNRARGQYGGPGGETQAEQ